MASDERATELLLSLRNGNQEALNELMPIIYSELQKIARRELRREHAGHTLNTTALVHEAYLKLVRLDRMEWQSRAHFLAIASQAMRRILVNHALHRKRIKRGQGAPHASIEEAMDLPATEANRILELDEALNRLADLNPRHARIIECRFFGGMTIEETATALDISPATAKRDWTLMRAWLRRELGQEA